MTEISLYKCGTQVWLKLAKVEGIITAANIRFDRINYEVTWFINGSYNSLWFFEEEFECRMLKDQKVGFK